jgi:integrase
VWHIFKKRVKAASLPEGRYSPHSLRAGFATAASEGGAKLPEIMAVTAHADEGAALSYIRSGQLFDNPALDAVGL